MVHTTDIHPGMDTDTSDESSKIFPTQLYGFVYQMDRWDIANPLSLERLFFRSFKIMKIASVRVRPTVQVEWRNLV